MNHPDKTRWLRRLENFDRALSQLGTACELEEYSDLERAGLVQTFGFTFELAWKVLKDLLFHEGVDAKTPREVIRQSFAMGYIGEDDAETLLDALDQRNLLSHVYLEDAAVEAERLINETYYPLLLRVHRALEARRTS